MIDRRDDRQVPTPKWIVWCSVGFIVIHVAMLLNLARRYSPTGDESRHFAAAVAAWYEGRFDLYPVNPPLARLVAVIPVIVVERGIPFALSPGLSPNHLEQLIVQSRFRDQEQFRWHLFLARCGVIPFSVLGAFVCFAWARDLYGPYSGMTATALWCFCPEMLGHGAIVACDVPGAVMGLLWLYCWWRWLCVSSRYRAYIAGVAFGFALLTKLTWLIGFAFGPTLIGILLLRGSRAGIRQKLGHVLFQQAIAIVIVNAGYLFHGSGTRLGDFDFVSVSFSGNGENRALAQSNSWDALHCGNRFRNGIFRGVPVPWPRDLVIGLDRQKLDFESGRLGSYLRGQWRESGWWYWYLYAFAIKTPLGYWVLFLMAMVWAIRRRRDPILLEQVLAIGLPALSIVALASWQSGFTDHFRYVMPAWPPIFVWCSQVFMRYRSPTLLVRWSGFLAVVWAVASSLVTYPHSLAYFNELAGGPSNGHQHLIGANLDWGQDNFLVQNWVNQHPERQPIHISQIERLWSLGLGQGCVASTTQPSNGADHENSPDHLRPRSGWHVIDVNSLHDRRGTFNWALRETPVGRIGFTQLIYFVNDENAAIMP